MLIKKAAGIEKRPGVPNKNKVASISKADVQKIAETKMPDLNAASLEAAMKHDRRHGAQHGRHCRRINEGRSSVPYSGSDYSELTTMRRI